MTTTITVRGHKIRTASQRRYIVVAVRTSAFAYLRPEAHREPFARIHKRSDSKATALDHARRYGVHNGSFAVVVDTVTGEEV